MFTNIILDSVFIKSIMKLFRLGESFSDICIGAILTQSSLSREVKAVTSCFISPQRIVVARRDCALIGLFSEPLVAPGLMGGTCSALYLETNLPTNWTT